DVEAARTIAAAAISGSDEVCVVANDNAPGQVVVSGHRHVVERAIAIAREQQWGRAVVLPLSAPCHSPLMAPAAKVMQKALDEVAVRSPVVPLVANVAASAISGPTEIKRELVGQVTAMVRWRESVLYLKRAEVEEVIEIGAGRVLAGMVRRIDPALATRSVGTPAEVEALI